MNAQERLDKELLDRLPKHSPLCPYVCFKEDLWVNCECNAKFLGKPFLHWQNEARELVVDRLLRASMLETSSIIGYLAHNRLIDLAKKESPELLKRAIEERATMSENMLHALFEG